MILYGIHYSPWSLRAKWALAHHHVDVEYREYLPMVTTPRLRLLLRDFSGPITVPVLIDGKTALRDSLDIARFAEKRGTGAALFSDAADVVETWTLTADQIAEAGRAITTFAVMHDPEASRESIPPFVPGAVRSLATPMVDLGARYLAQKYSFRESDRDAAEERMRSALERVANRLVESETLGDVFGWPDIAVAAALQFVKPAADWARLGRASRNCWTRSALADEFSDVLVWRDRTLAEHQSHRG